MSRRDRLYQNIVDCAHLAKKDIAKKWAELFQDIGVSTITRRVGNTYQIIGMSEDLTIVAVYSVSKYNTNLLVDVPEVCVVGSKTIKSSSFSTDRWMSDKLVTVVNEALES